MKKILIIINPSSGADIPILSYLNRELQKSQVEWDFVVTKKTGDITQFTEDGIKKGYDGIAVYGGDGSMMEAASVLVGKTIPLILLPGGTSNILAKELQVPLDLVGALQLVTKKTFTIKTIDVGMCNDTLFLLRVSSGILAEMITESNTDAKLSVGQLAYTITVAQRLSSETTSTFTFEIDGKEFSETGISLVVANSGNIGFSGLSILPHVQVDDGLLNVFLIKNSDLGYLTNFAKETLLNRSDTTIDHWTGKDIFLKSMSPKQVVIADDGIIDSSSIRVRVIPKALPIVVPQP